MTSGITTQWGKARAVSGFRAFSMLGSEISLFALILRERGHGATYVSILLAAGTVSMVVMVPLAGWLADRYSTKAIIPMTSVLQSSLIISLIYQHNMISLAITVFASSSCGAIENPTFMALLPNLVSNEDFSKQMGFSQTLYAMAGLFAPAVGGILVSQTGYKTPFITDAISFLVLAAAPYFLNVNRKPEFTADAEKIKAADGMKFIFRDRYLRSFAILIAAFLFAAGTVNIANLFLLTKVLHASVFIYGLSGAAFASGMIVGGVALMKITINESQRSKLAVAVLIITALLILGMSASGHWSIVLVLDFLIGVLISILTNIISTIFILRSPSEMRGRIGAALNAFINLGTIGALIVSGPILDWLGTRRLLIVAGLAALLLIALFSPAVIREETS